MIFHMRKELQVFNQRVNAQQFDGRSQTKKEQNIIAHIKENVPIKRK